MKDNPNPRANIALVCKYQFFYHVFETVYEHLDQVEFVLDFTGLVANQPHPDEYKEKVRKFFKDKGVYWRDPSLSDSSIPEFCNKYAVLVAPFYEGILEHPCNKDKKKVRICTSLAKANRAYSLQNAYFDLILCPGPYSLEKLKIYSAKKVAIGDPKLDQFFRGRANKRTVGEPKEKQYPAKETLLYLPTYGDLSSLEVMTPALIKLTDSYNIIVKIHHITALYEKEKITPMENSALQIFEESVSLTEIIGAADIVISDNSGAIFDALAFQKPLVLIDNIEQTKERFFSENLFFSSDGQKRNTVLTSSESLEQIIKRKGETIAPTVEASASLTGSVDVQRLRTAILQARDSRYTQRQKEILSLLYYPENDGFAGKRAGDEIKKIMSDEEDRDHSLERLLDAFEHHVRGNQEAALQSATKQLNSFEEIKKLPYGARMKATWEEFFA